MRVLHRRQPRAAVDDEHVIVIPEAGDVEAGDEGPPGPWADFSTPEEER
jgi:hypothetical protein